VLGRGGVPDDQAGGVWAGRVPVEAEAVDGGAQPVAPAAVAEPAAPQVPVEGPRGEQVGQYQLVQRGAVVVGEPLGLHHWLQQPRWQGQPGQPQAGGERLAGRARVDDPLGSSP
jgi:hypothetical protein